MAALEPLTSSSDRSPGIPTPSHRLTRQEWRVELTVRRPPIGEVSPCCHRPSGGDVACSIDVGVAPPGSAGLALEDRLALAVSGCDVPARGATLRRVRSRDLLDPAVSLVLQACGQPAPTASVDGAVEPALLSDTDARFFDGAARRAGHRPHIKRLDPDHGEPPRQVGGGFLHPVFAPIPLASFQRRDRPFRLSATLGTTLGAGRPLLQHLQTLRLTRGKTGCVQQLAGRQRGRHRNTAVDPDHAAITRTADRIGDVRERDMPAASPITCDPVRLDTVWHRARQPESHPPDLGHPYPPKAAVQPLNLMRLHADLPKPFMHTAFTPRRTAMRAGGKVLHGLCEIPQRLLLHRLTSSSKPPVLGAGLRQLRGLLDIAGRLAPWLPVLVLLHRQIPHVPRVAAVRQQALLLLRGGQPPKPRHSSTVTADTDTPDRSARPPLGIGIFPGLKSRVCSRRRIR